MVSPQEVTHLGKLVSYGSSCTQFMVRLADETEVFVRACDQSKVVEKWLRKTAKSIQALRPGLAVGWLVVWAPLPPFVS